MKFVNFIQGQKPNLGVLNSSGKIVSFADLGIETNDMNEFIIYFDKFKHKLKDLDSKTAYEIPKE
ncbi:TPA: fumarylacetoacetase, partial [Campylobacter jejuni]